MDNWEKIVIGTILTEPEAFLEAVHLKASDFSLGMQPVWKELAQLFSAGILSTKAFIESLREKSLLDQMGDESIRGEAFIASLYEHSSPEAFPTAVEKVMDSGIRKELQNQLTYIIAQTRNGKSSREIIDDTIEWLYDARRTKASEARFIGDFLPGFNQKMVMMRKGEKVPGWHSRIEAVNNIVGNVAQSEFLIVAGYGGGGKSSILRKEALATALEGEHVLTFNGENDIDWYLSYGIAYLSAQRKDKRWLDTEKLKRPDKMSEKEWEVYEECRTQLQSLPWLIQPIDNAKNMFFTAKQLHNKYNLSLVQVDQIQNMATTDFEKLESATYDLRGMATNLNVPVMAAHQLRKKAKAYGKDESEDTTKFKEPQMEDLLYAGEHAGKNIWMLHRVKMTPEVAKRFPANVGPTGYLLPEDYWGTYVVRIKVVKNSSGRLGKTPDMAWHRGLNEFRPLEDNWSKPNVDLHNEAEKIIKTYPKPFNPVPKPTRDTRR